MFPMHYSWSYKHAKLRSWSCPVFCSVWAMTVGWLMSEACICGHANKIRASDGAWLADGRALCQNLHDCRSSPDADTGVISTSSCGVTSLRAITSWYSMMDDASSLRSNYDINGSRLRVSFFHVRVPVRSWKQYQCCTFIPFSHGVVFIVVNQHAMKMLVRSFPREWNTVRLNTDGTINNNVRKL